VTPKISDAREAKGKRNNDLLREEESVVDEEIAGIPQKVIREHPYTLVDQRRR
jgi:hypothetical protein